MTSPFVHFSVLLPSCRWMSAWCTRSHPLLSVHAVDMWKHLVTLNASWFRTSPWKVFIIDLNSFLKRDYLFGGMKHLIVFILFFMQWFCEFRMHLYVAECNFCLCLWAQTLNQHCSPACVGFVFVPPSTHHLTQHILFFTDFNSFLEEWIHPN